ncbi:hypothetical protein [Achromobacter aloeverae]|uniref:hypothetical protein n=1 Tax=Achromobacter aloeverae TaxID=1750518 RepID=UPI00100F4A58|nr:hypothetical protein [Achromobacter aloeverae]
MTRVDAGISGNALEHRGKRLCVAFFGREGISLFGAKNNPKETNCCCFAFRLNNNNQYAYKYLEISFQPALLRFM